MNMYTVQGELSYCILLYLCQAQESFSPDGLSRRPVDSHFFLLINCSFEPYSIFWMAPLQLLAKSPAAESR